MDEEFIRPATCQFCLADPKYTGLGPDPTKRCPVCGSAYCGPRRSKEYVTLVEAQLVSRED